MIEEAPAWKHTYTTMFLEHLYICFSENIDPRRFGWPGRRNRYFGVAFHRSFVLDVYSNLQNVIPLFERTCHTTWECFLIAHADPELSGELDLELEWAINRKKSLAHGQSLQNIRGLPGGHSSWH